MGVPVLQRTQERRGQCAMPNSLPDNVEKYGESPLFNEETVPAKLRSSHSTKSGVWGKVCVSEGTLKFVIVDDTADPQILSSNQHGIIKPEQAHFVEVIGPVQFKLEFYR